MIQPRTVPTSGPLHLLCLVSSQPSPEPWLGIQGLGQAVEKGTDHPVGDLGGTLTRTSHSVGIQGVNQQVAASLLLISNKEMRWGLGSPALPPAGKDTSGPVAQPSSSSHAPPQCQKISEEFCAV